MTLVRHLIIQELCLRPSGEWTPAGGWTVVRVAEGAGYCLQAGSARELNVGDMALAGANAAATFRASQLGVLKLEYFQVLPQCLNGLLTVTEWRQLEDVSSQMSKRVLHVSANEPAAQKFTRLVTQPQRDGLAARSALLQLWASNITNLLPIMDAGSSSVNLRERFRQFIGKMSETELAVRTLPQLAEEMHCSERHFSRLFREEFHISLRARQTELRLQRARQLLVESDSKIINIAFESGYRHLGLFNSMFKKRFGVTPSKWRQQNRPVPYNIIKRAMPMLALLLLLAKCFFVSNAFAATADSSAAKAKAAAPHFAVEKYLVTGNSLLTPGQLAQVLTNSQSAFGTNVTFDDIRAQLADLQMAYRERGYVTVSVGLPQQRLTNAEVKIKVTEGRLGNIKVEGNNWYSTENVLRALPSLHTNMLLNSHVFQRELDNANSSRDRQVYPVIAPGPEPGTTELTLKVKDRLPLHARAEINNSGTPGTPESRVAFNAQYDNLWDLDHQMGVSYSFTPLDYGAANPYYFTPIDLPLIANYSAYYRLPLGRATSVQQQIDDSHGQFGYNEVTHQFQMPPPSGRPDLTIYASRAVSDTVVQFDSPKVIFTTNLISVASQATSENVTLNEGVGFKFSWPLPQVGRMASTLTWGADFKHYEVKSIKGDVFYELVNTTNAGQTIKYGGVLYSLKQMGDPLTVAVTHQTLEYFPLNVGYNGSIPDSFGQTFFNAQANFNVTTISGRMNEVSYSTNASDNFFTAQLGAGREQRLYKDWTMLLRADGQWASTPLFSNEQYGMGGSAGVRGYTDGEAYGDMGWRVMIEPRTPLMSIGMVDGDLPFWVRASVFMDYGELRSVLSHPSGYPHQANDFWGAGGSLTANIGNHLDARLTIAVPLLSAAATSAGDVHVYFGVGAQF